MIQVCHDRLTKAPMTCSIQLTGINPPTTQKMGHVVGGDAPHTLAFIVSSVFKVLPTTHTQTLQSEANFASNNRRCRKRANPAALSEEPIADRECGRPRCVRDPRAGREIKLYVIEPEGNPLFTKTSEPA